MKRYGSQPITVETWPGPMKPSMWRSGDARIASSAGMMVTWLQKTEKFSTSSAAARSTVIAVEGVVVSKPMAMNTTRRSGWLRAILSELSGEYTIWMSAPRALASRKEPRAGTPSRSPNES